MGKAGSKRLEFSTIFNVRDLCGYQTPTGPVREGRYLRSGDTMFLSDEDREALLDLGVRRVCDLRMAIERPDLTNRLAHVEGVSWKNFSMADDRTMTPEWTKSGAVVQFVVEGYQRMLTDAEGMRELMEFIAAAKPDDCVLFHCAAGMDRTGIVGILILGLAGVATDDLVADYAYSFGDDEEVDALIASFDPEAPCCPHDGLLARVQAMYALLDWVESEYGSIHDLVRSWGVSEESCEAIRAHALDATTPDITAAFRSWVLSRHPLGCTAEEVDEEHIRFEADGLVAECNLYAFEGESTICELRVTRTADEEAVFFLHFLLDDMDRAEDLFHQMEAALEDESARSATKILLCCTSALTTSMFAAKMQEAARALSLDYEISAKPVSVALSSTEDFAAVLLAPQVAHMRQQMVEAHPGTIVFEIPAKTFGSYDAGGALRLLMQAMRPADLSALCRGILCGEGAGDIRLNRAELAHIWRTLSEICPIHAALAELSALIPGQTAEKTALGLRILTELALADVAVDGDSVKISLVSREGKADLMQSAAWRAHHA